ncbi:hypothetical protein B9Z55_027348 [Caenorhabditis nigoni]|uniref:Uncharacterized protein n=1 Tax=Caenorhabditis nigoni TaxID=1611254 RepID=A0A2G5SGP0_9PELO|nr:hypothetical protein B9Z55_027342 [Caenorhabditis nigoni]PIC14036.1 hypothetical protein B9Z55_027348 [Caenorhabditis nigoni]
MSRSVCHVSCPNPNHHSPKVILFEGVKETDVHQVVTIPVRKQLHKPTGPGLCEDRTLQSVVSPLATTEEIFNLLFVGMPELKAQPIRRQEEGEVLGT